MNLSDLRERAISLGNSARSAFQHHLYSEGHNPDPASYAVETLNAIIDYNNTQGFFNIYKGARFEFRGIFRCFDNFNYKHIEGLRAYSGDLGDMLLNYCGHNNLRMKNCEELPELVKTGHDIVAILLEDKQFQQFCKNINPFKYDDRGVLDIHYSKRKFKVALFMHKNLASFMNALFVDTDPIESQIEEYTRPIKCWLSMFFSQETYGNIKHSVRQQYLRELSLSPEQFIIYPHTIVENVTKELESRGFESRRRRSRSRSRSPIAEMEGFKSSRSRGGAHKRTARVPRKQRKQRKQRKSRKQRK